MPCEVVGLHFFADSSELHPLKGVFDADFVRRYAKAHESAGFDRVLIGQTATWPDGPATAAHIAAVTSTLKFMIAHRPGFVAPTLAARMFATIDQLSGGRAGVHIITGASDVETQADGDFLTKDERYRRSREYVDILRMIWTNPEPVDHEGGFYRFRGGYSEVKPVQANIPIFWGGASDLAVELGAQCADVYAIGPGTLHDTQALVTRFKTAAIAHGRAPGISMSMRVIMGDTEDAAWRRAGEVLASVTRHQASGTPIGRDKGSDDPGTRDAIALADRGDVLDQRLWTGITKATQGRLHATALVGTPDQITDTLLRYYELGVDRFLLNGFFTFEDLPLFRDALIPAIKTAVARRDAAASGAA